MPRVVRGEGGSLSKELVSVALGEKLKCATRDFERSMFLEVRELL